MGDTFPTGSIHDNHILNFMRLYQHVGMASPHALECDMLLVIRVNVLLANLSVTLFLVISNLQTVASVCSRKSAANVSKDRLTIHYPGDKQDFTDISSEGPSSGSFFETSKYCLSPK